MRYNTYISGQINLEDATGTVLGIVKIQYVCHLQHFAVASSDMRVKVKMKIDQEEVEDGNTF